IPDIVQSGIHALTAKRAVNVSSVACQEDPPDAQLGNVPVVNAKVAAPMEPARLDPTRRSLTKYLLYKVQRRSVSFGTVDRRDDAPTGVDHWERSKRSEFAGTQLELVCRKNVVHIDVRQQERGIVFASEKRHAQCLADRTMSAIAADDEGSSDLVWFASPRNSDSRAVVLLT